MLPFAEAGGWGGGSQLPTSFSSTGYRYCWCYFRRRLPSPIQAARSPRQVLRACRAPQGLNKEAAGREPEPLPAADSSNPSPFPPKSPSAGQAEARSRHRGTAGGTPLAPHLPPRAAPGSPSPVRRCHGAGSPRLLGAPRDGCGQRGAALPAGGPRQPPGRGERLLVILGDPPATGSPRPAAAARPGGAPRPGSVPRGPPSRGAAGTWRGPGGVLRLRVRVGESRGGALHSGMVPGCGGIARL